MKKLFDDPTVDSADINDPDVDQEPQFSQPYEEGDVNDISTDLEIIEETMERTQEDGERAQRLLEGMEAHTLTDAQIRDYKGLARIYGRLNDGTQTPMPSFEDFQNQYTREQAFEISTEGLGQVIKNIWKAFLGFVKTFFAKMRLFFKRLFQMTLTTKEYDVYIQKRLNKIIEKKLIAKDDQTVQSNIGRYISPGHHDFSEGLSVLTDSIYYFKSFNELSQAYANELVPICQAFKKRLGTTSVLKDITASFEYAALIEYRRREEAGENVSSFKHCEQLDRQYASTSNLEQKLKQGEVNLKEHLAMSELSPKDNMANILSALLFDKVYSLLSMTLVDKNSLPKDIKQKFDQVVKNSTARVDTRSVKYYVNSDQALIGGLRYYAIDFKTQVAPTDGDPDVGNLYDRQFDLVVWVDPVGFEEVETPVVTSFDQMKHLFEASNQLAQIDFKTSEQAMSLIENELTDLSRFLVKKCDGSSEIERLKVVHKALQELRSEMSETTGEIIRKYSQEEREVYRMYTMANTIYIHYIKNVLTETFKMIERCNLSTKIYLYRALNEWG